MVKSYTALVVLIYNNAENIVDFVNSVEMYNTASIKYIIVDNGSTKSGVVERTSLFLSQKFGKDLLVCGDDAPPEKVSLPYVTYLRSKSNDGFSGGNNKGLRLAYLDDEIKNVFIVNDDVVFVADIIPSLCQKLETLPCAGMVCPIHLFPNGEVDVDCVRLLLDEWKLLKGMVLNVGSGNEMVIRHNPEYLNKDFIEIKPPIGPCILMRKNDIMDVGGYDEHVFLYYEEYILYKKFKRLGRKNYAIPSCRLIHKGSVTAANESKFFLRNVALDSCRYYLKHYCELSFLQKMLLPIMYWMGKTRIRLSFLLKPLFRC